MQAGRKLAPAAERVYPCRWLLQAQDRRRLRCAEVRAGALQPQIRRRCAFVQWREAASAEQELRIAQIRKVRIASASLTADVHAELQSCIGTCALTRSSGQVDKLCWLLRPCLTLGVECAGDCSAGCSGTVAAICSAPARSSRAGSHSAAALSQTCVHILPARVAAAQGGDAVA